MFNLKRVFINCFLFLCICSFVFSSNNQEDIPSQKEQIEVYNNWLDDPSLENATELIRISEKNFNIIEKILAKRFCPQSEKQALFKRFKASALEKFNKGEMNLKILTDHYSIFLTLLDPEGELQENSIKSAKRAREEVYEFFTPFPIVSQDGLADLDVLYKLPTQGIWYLGVPLAETTIFDGFSAGPLKFFQHDLFHGNFLGDPAVKEIAFQFLQKFTHTLVSITPADQEREILDVILFNIIHESGATFPHEKGFGLFNIFSFSEHPTLEKEGKILLEAGKISMESPDLIAIYQGFAKNAVEKGLMALSQYQPPIGKNISLDEISHINSENMLQKYVEMINQKIEFYKSKFDE